MFNHIFGRKQVEVNKSYQRKLNHLLNTPEGKNILAWMIKTYILDDKSSLQLSHAELSYINGRNDFIKLLVAISDFDFSNFIEESNNV